MPDIKSRNTHLIKEKAGNAGFDFCGISKAEFLEEEAPKLEAWLQHGFHGKMKYMEHHFDKRLDPSRLVPGAKSVVSLIYNYYPEKTLPEEDNYKLAKYAYGEDYHFVLKRKLKDLLRDLREEIGEINGRVFVDSAPVMERTWAERSGIGWTGKNTLLLNRKSGSFFFLAQLIIDLELEYDAPVKDYCGTCTRCMDACPTDAFPQPYLLDASKCISYLTIELKDKIPGSFEGKYKDWIFGCDICQDVCPWNRFSRPHKEPSFKPGEELKKLRKNDWNELTRETFNRIFKNSAVKRAKYEGLKRNIEFVKEMK